MAQTTTFAYVLESSDDNVRAILQAAGIKATGQSLADKLTLAHLYDESKMLVFGQMDKESMARLLKIFTDYIVRCYMVTRHIDIVLYAAMNPDIVILPPVQIVERYKAALAGKGSKYLIGDEAILSNYETTKAGSTLHEQLDLCLTNFSTDKVKTILEADTFRKEDLYLPTLVRLLLPKYLELSRGEDKGNLYEYAWQCVLLVPLTNSISSAEIKATSLTNVNEILLKCLPKTLPPDIMPINALYFLYCYYLIFEKWSGQRYLKPVFIEAWLQMVQKTPLASDIFIDPATGAYHSPSVVVDKMKALLSFRRAFITYEEFGSITWLQDTRGVRQASSEEIKELLTQVGGESKGTLAESRAVLIKTYDVLLGGDKKIYEMAPYVHLASYLSEGEKEGAGPRYKDVAKHIIQVVEPLYDYLRREHLAWRYVDVILTMKILADRKERLLASAPTIEGNSRIRPTDEAYDEFSREVLSIRMRAEAMPFLPDTASIDEIRDAYRKEHKAWRGGDVEKVTRSLNKNILSHEYWEIAHFSTLYDDINHLLMNLLISYPLDDVLDPALLEVLRKKYVTIKHMNVLDIANQLKLEAYRYIFALPLEPRILKDEEAYGRGRIGMRLIITMVYRNENFKASEAELFYFLYCTFRFLVEGYNTPDLVAAWVNLTKMYPSVTPHFLNKDGQPRTMEEIRTEVSTTIGLRSFI